MKSSYNLACAWVASNSRRIYGDDFNIGQLVDRTHQGITWRHEFVQRHRAYIQGMVLNYRRHYQHSV